MPNWDEIDLQLQCMKRNFPKLHHFLMNEACNNYLPETPLRVAIVFGEQQAIDDLIILDKQMTHNQYRGLDHPQTKSIFKPLKNRKGQQDD